MKILGQYDTSGNYQNYKQPADVVVFGDTLRDEDGFVMGIKDEYGDWVSPNLYRLGLKSKLKVE